jgi:hypothetical protein
MMLVDRAIMAWAAALTIATAAAARAADPPDAAAKQVAGLFMQSCVQFAGDREGLRGWATKLDLRVLPPAVQGRFLHGLPGVVFDASNQDGKFVLVSEEGGSCSVIAERASGAKTVVDLEKDLNDARISFRMTAEIGDPEERLLQHREYVASQGDRAWLLLISTVKDAAGGQVMLTASRH